MPDFSVRRANRSDVSAIASLQRQMMEYHEALDPRIRHRADLGSSFIEWLRALLNDEEAIVYVSEIDGSVVGYIIGLIRDTFAFYPPRIGYIADLSVDENYRRHGVGAALVREIKTWFRSKKMTVAWANVSVTNPTAQSFWRGQGGDDFQDILYFDLTAPDL